MWDRTKKTPADNLQISYFQLDPWLYIVASQCNLLCFWPWLPTLNNKCEYLPTFLIDIEQLKDTFWNYFLLNILTQNRTMGVEITANTFCCKSQAASKQIPIYFSKSSHYSVVLRKSSHTPRINSPWRQSDIPAQFIFFNLDNRALLTREMRKPFVRTTFA